MFSLLSVTSKPIFTKDVIEGISATSGSSDPFFSKEPGRAFAGNQEESGIFLWLFQVSMGTTDSVFKDAWDQAF